ncbi:metallophosphoesterase [Helicobacter cynogastricus]|uniref:metallophosphoesterase n=1 Tax=Helicobacter cynogastricus TaxID=329937 RepID=UPI0013150EEC|nr:metallophosphoesterase [Helicobacter cynogastricus]
MSAIYGGRVNLPSLHPEAIFIADAHHKPRACALPKLLDQLLSAPPTQVFFMGDIFHVLVGSIKSSITPHKEVLAQIHALSRVSQVFYFEGNHDLLLGSLRALEHVRVLARAEQPAFFLYQDRLLALAHGDLFVGWGYGLYISLLRYSGVLYFLGGIDYALPALYPLVQRRIDAKRIRNLELTHTAWARFAKQRLACYGACARQKGLELGGVIEGHFHVGKGYQSKKGFYYALPSFYGASLAPTLAWMSENWRN